ncbi:hypothetical protein U0070_018452 [Myodes glareolus]|uniref:60S ribosomal protein L28 n=1 Tax=Myodes glareolus TaxID=447135 RepID=A0AAW0JVV4_MYOGA
MAEKTLKQNPCPKLNSAKSEAQFVTATLSGSMQAMTPNTANAVLVPCPGYCRDTAKKQKQGWRATRSSVMWMMNESFILSVRSAWPQGVKSGRVMRSRSIVETTARLSLEARFFDPQQNDGVHQYVVRKPLNKEGKTSRSKAHRILHLKQYTKKNKEGAAECARLLLKRMKEAKANTKNRLSKDMGCPGSEVLLQSPVKRKSSRVASNIRKKGLDTSLRFISSLSLQLPTQMTVAKEGLSNPPLHPHPLKTYTLQNDQHYLHITFFILSRAAVDESILPEEPQPFAARHSPHVRSQWENTLSLACIFVGGPCEETLQEERLQPDLVHKNIRMK